jgi:hypothetical protein
MSKGCRLFEVVKVLILNGLSSLVSTQIGNLLSRKVSLSAFFVWRISPIRVLNRVLISRRLACLTGAGLTPARYRDLARPHCTYAKPEPTAKSGLQKTPRRDSIRGPTTVHRKLRLANCAADTRILRKSHDN